MIKNYFIKLLRKCFDVASREVRDDAINTIKADMLALQYLTPLNTKYLPWTMPVLSPSSVATILNDIIINRRTSIIECGGGISTLYIARLLKERTGHLYTIEHEETWIATLNELLEAEGLNQFVTLIFAPLIPSDLSLNNGLWYNPDAIVKALDSIEIEFLIVDGPDLPEDPDIRYPAVPFFKERLSQNYAIVLDDVKRRGEREILRQWQEYLNIDFKIRGEIALGTSKSGFVVY